MLSFIILSLVMIVGAIGVITLKQPVHAALSLVGTLMTLAVTYVTLQAHFLATIQVIVYAGAIMVLFLFVIMLLNIQEDGQAAGMGWLRYAAYGVGGASALGLVVAIFRGSSPLPEAAVIDAALAGGNADLIGETLFTQFLLPFHLVGVLLLTGIVGAVSLVQRRAEAAEEAQEKAQAQAATPVAAVAGGPSPSGVATLPKPDVNLEPSELLGTRQESVPEDVETGTDAGIMAKEVTHDADPEALEEKATPPADGGTTGSPDALRTPDDLKRISGVGPKLEQLLHDNGIYTFEQIAGLDEAGIEELEEQLDEFKGRIERDDWVGQAETLAAEKRAK